MSNRSQFYTVPEAARKFGVDRRTMSGWVASGKINAIVTPGGHRRILRSEIDALIEQKGFAQSYQEGRKSILIVDDEDTVRKMLKQRLSREEFAVETASDGFKAGLKAREMNPDLIILDLMMEGADGFEVCRTVKNDASLKHAKVLVLTGFDTPKNRERALQEGADGYLSKGAPFRDFLKQIRELLT